jgi:hypothetical protein
VEFAVQDDYVLGGGGRLPAERAYELAHGLGVSVVRINVLSSEVAGHGWDRLDGLVDRVRREGLIPQVTIMGRPKWYVDNQPDGGCPHLDPDPAKFGGFCTAVVEHFGSRVGRYAIWNEPNHPTFLASARTKDTSSLYAHLYHVGFRAVRAASPKAVVLWGEIAGGPTSRSWVKRALVAGWKLNGHKPVSASGFAIHPYQYVTDPAVASTDDALRFGDLPYLKGFLQRTATFRTSVGKPVPIYVTEFGWFNPPAKQSIPDALRARRAAKALGIARDLGLAQFLYFTLVESPGHPGNWDTGIVHLDGSTSMTYDAMAQAK